MSILSPIHCMQPSFPSRTMQDRRKWSQWRKIDSRKKDSLSRVFQPCHSRSSHIPSVSGSFLVRGVISKSPSDAGKRSQQAAGRRVGPGRRRITRLLVGGVSLCQPVHPSASGISLRRFARNRLLRRLSAAFLVTSFF